MKHEVSRRKAVGALAAVALQFGSVTAAQGRIGLPAEAAATPKLCLPAFEGGGSPGRPDERGMRRVTQLGVTHVIMLGPSIPWAESEYGLAWIA
jgi:hypothetical protein